VPLSRTQLSYEECSAAFMASYVFDSVIAAPIRLLGSEGVLRSPKSVRRAAAGSAVSRAPDPRGRQSEAARPERADGLCGKPVVSGSSRCPGWRVRLLTTIDRRAFERELVEAYRAALDVPASERPSSDETWLRYRASAADGLAIWPIAILMTFMRTNDRRSSCSPTRRLSRISMLRPL